MKFIRRKVGQSLSNETSPSQILSRKALRQAYKKQGKIAKAMHYAKSNHTSKVCVSSSDLEKIKYLPNADILDSLKTKILSNEKALCTSVKNKKKLKKKKKKAIKKSQKPKEEEEEEEESESFQLSSNSNLRMAKLQEFVNQEVKKVDKKSTSGKKDEVPTNIKPNVNLIKDKYKLEDLKLGQRNDEKEFNKLARKLKLNNYQKKGVCPEFADEFGSILKDIEEGNMENLNKYSEIDMNNSDSDNDLENDLMIAIGNGESEAKSENGVHKPKEDKERKSLCNGNYSEMELDSDDSFMEEDSDALIKDEEDSDDLIKDEEDSDNSIEDESERNEFLDDEAEEGDDSDDSDEEKNENEEELAFESGGSVLLTGGGAQQTLSHPTMNSIFSLYASSSEDDESDLDGFIVDDSYVEYDSEASEEDNIGEVEESITKFVKEERNKSRIKGRKPADSSRIYDSLSDSSPVKNENCQTTTNKRRRLCSDSSDCSQLLESNNKVEENGNVVSADLEPSKKKKRKKKKNRTVNGENEDQNSTTQPISLQMIGSDSEEIKSKFGKNKFPQTEESNANKENNVIECSMPVNINKTDDELVSRKKKRKKRKNEDSINNEVNGNIKEKVDLSLDNKVCFPNLNNGMSVNGVNNDFINDKSNIDINGKSSKSVKGQNNVHLNGDIPSSKKKKSKKKQEQNENVNQTDNQEVKNIKSIIKGKKFDENGTLVKRKGKEKRVSFSLPDDANPSGVNDTNGSSGDEAPSLSNSERRVPPLNEYYEDIYGRLRDKQGNVVGIEAVNNITSGSKYVPPAMRKLLALNTDAKKKEQLKALQRTLKGLLNRLAESNLAGIANQIESYYQSNSRNDMNEIMTNLLFETVISPALTPERLVQELALLISILSANVGLEVGAHILTEFTVKFIEELESAKSANSLHTESKQLDNMLQFIAELYNFKVVHCSLIYDILSKLLEGFEEKEVDLILLVLRSVGFGLRKDDALALKTFINNAQVKADSSTSKETSETFSRIKFMLEVLIAIRNNNMSKVPNYDPSHGIHLKSLLKGIVRKGCRLCELKISLEDILKSNVHGKWWVVGSAWSGGLKEDQFSEESTSKSLVVDNLLGTDEFTAAFRKKAAKLHMSRPPRINILYIVTDGSENCTDAFEKLIQLKISSHEEQEIFNVILYCCQRNKFFNKLFPIVAVKLCKFKRSFSRILQFCLWDKFKEIHNLPQKETANLAKFIAYVISENGLNMSLFKTINFLEADDQMVSFLRQSLMAILLHSTGIYAVSQAFNHLCSSPKLTTLREAIRFFIIKFVTPKNAEGSKEKTMLASRVKLALNILTSATGVSL